MSYRLCNKGVEKMNYKLMLFLLLVFILVCIMLFQYCHMLDIYQTNCFHIKDTYDLRVDCIFMPRC